MKRGNAPLASGQTPPLGKETPAAWPCGNWSEFTGRSGPDAARPYRNSHRATPGLPQMTCHASATSGCDGSSRRRPITSIAMDTPHAAGHTGRNHAIFWNERQAGPVHPVRLSGIRLSWIQRGYFAPVRPRGVTAHPDSRSQVHRRLQHPRASYPLRLSPTASLQAATPHARNRSARVAYA